MGRTGVRWSGTRRTAGVGRLISSRMLLCGVSGLAMVMAVGACSSSSSRSSSRPPASSSGSRPTGPSTSVQATAAPIKVGVVCSCSGVFGPSFQAELDVYRAWVDTVNAAGGVSGHPVRLTVEDDGANPGTSVTDAQTLIQSHVDAILDLSGDDETWATAVQQANVPVVGGIVTETTYFTNPDFYPEGQTDDFAGYATIDTAKLAAMAAL